MSKSSKSTPKQKITPKLLVAVYNNQAAYPSVDSVAKRLKVSKPKLDLLLQALSPALKSKLLNRSRSEIPVSENQDKVLAATREECIEHLREVVLMNPDTVISRNAFRVHGQLAESAWNQHFGTFQEFKRQAGVTLTRPQHKLEREIAKHASVDHYRELNVERADYAEKYVRPAKGRFVTAMVCSDLHDVEVDPFWLRVWLDTVKRVQPDLIVFNGDVFDLPEFGRYPVDPREWDVLKRIRFVHDKILRPTREAAPNTQQDFIEGNHEARLLIHLADATPAMRAVLSDLHGFTVSKLLGLDQFEINYIARADLAAWTKRDISQELRKNYNVYWQALMCHHFPEGRAMGVPGVNGHHHKHIVWAEFNHTYGPYEWHQAGCGHKREASYCAGEKWNMGFDIVNVDREQKRAQHDYVTVGDFAVSGGKFYFRNEDEPAF